MPRHGEYLVPEGRRLCPPLALPLQRSFRRRLRWRREPGPRGSTAACHGIAATPGDPLLPFRQTPSLSVPSRRGWESLSLVLSPVGGAQWELGSSQLLKNHFQRPMKARVRSRSAGEVSFSRRGLVSARQSWRGGSSGRSGACQPAPGRERAQRAVRAACLLTGLTEMQKPLEG